MMCVVAAHSTLHDPRFCKLFLAHAAQRDCFVTLETVRSCIFSRHARRTCARLLSETRSRPRFRRAPRTATYGTGHLPSARDVAHWHRTTQIAHARTIYTYVSTQGVRLAPSLPMRSRRMPCVPHTMAAHCARHAKSMRAGGELGAAERGCGSRARCGLSLIHI